MVTHMPSCRKNEALAAEDRALAETAAPSSEKVVTGEPGMSDKDVAARHEAARQHGAAQHSQAAHELKKVGLAVHAACYSM